jgi:hypothetical protein
VGVWKRSGELSAKSWGLVKENRELLRFPTMGAVVGVLTAVVVIGPGIVVLAVADGNLGLIIAGAAVILVGAYLATFAVLRFSAGLVAAADELLHDRPCTYAEGMARSKGHGRALAGWALITVTVGALLSLLRGDGGDGAAVAVIRLVAAGLVGAAWALISFFTLPLIVLEDLGPVQGLKRSAGIVKDRWGEAAVGGVRVTVRAALWWLLPGIVLLVAGVTLAVVVDTTAGIVAGVVVGVIGMVLLIIGSVLASAARTVFGVALFRYATTNVVVGPFTQDDMDHAVRRKRSGRKAA